MASSGMYGGEATLYGTDPELAALYRRRKYAEQLMQAGGDTSPIQSPFQGLNRIAQSLIGAYDVNEADKGARAIGDERKATREAGNAEFARLLTGGGGQPSPMAAALTGQTQQPGGTLKDRIHMAEAGGSMAPGIVGDGGLAGGPMQVHAAALADVNRRLGTNYTHEQIKADPKLGKMVGDTYVDILAEQTGGDERQTAAAYNAGLGRVKAAVAAGGPNWEQNLPESTRNTYLPKVFGAQPQAAPAAPQGPDPRLERVQALEAYAVRQSQSQDPRIQAQGRMMWEQSKTLAGQIEADRVRADNRAARVPHTVTMQDADGKSVGIYEMGPNGPGRRLGAAPKQPGESGGPFGGTGMEAQASNVLLGIGPKIANGTATEAERGQYALAYEHIANGKIGMIPDPSDPTGQRQVMARIPGAVPPQFPPPTGPAQAQAGAPPSAGPAGQPGQAGTPQPIPGTQTSTISAGDRSTLRKAETEAASIVTSLDRFLDTRGKAGVGDRAASMVGIPTELNTTFNAAALMAKGEALFNLGVLNGPDLDIIRRTLADPATIGGAMASQDTVKKQVGVIKDLIQSRLDAARQNFGGQAAPDAPAARPADTLPPGFKEIR